MCLWRIGEWSMCRTGRVDCRLCGLTIGEAERVRTGAAEIH